MTVGSPFTQLNLFDSDLERRFREFDARNPQVYELFQKFAFEAIRSGHEHLGAKLIFERMRWHTTVETRGDEYRLNNNYTAYYARKFMREFPQHRGFFRTRTASGHR